MLNLFVFTPSGRKAADGVVLDVASWFAQAVRRLSPP